MKLASLAKRDGKWVCQYQPCLTLYGVDDTINGAVIRLNTLLRDHGYGVLPRPHQ